jgi:hypothetical protein
MNGDAFAHLALLGERALLAEARRMDVVIDSVLAV